MYAEETRHAKVMTCGHKNDSKKETDHLFFEILERLLHKLFHLSAPLNSLVFEAGARGPEWEMLDCTDMGKRKKGQFKVSNANPCCFFPSLHR